MVLAQMDPMEGRVQHGVAICTAPRVFQVREEIGPLCVDLSLSEGGKDEK